MLADRRGFAIILVTLTLVATITLDPPSALASDAGAFVLPDEGEVLRYQRVIGELEHPDPGPEVVLYADGRLQVRRPVYQTKAGLWQTRLDLAEMRALLEDVVANGLVDIDVQELRQRKATIQRQRAEAARRTGTSPTLYAIGDPDRSVLTLTLAAYSPPGDLSSPMTGPITRSWEWMDLYGDAGRFPEIRELAAFHRLELKMIEFIDSDSFERVPVEEVAP